MEGFDEKKVAVLFAMKDSNYNKFSECDVYDIERDAKSYNGNLPAIAHPPCRLWGKLRRFSTAPEEEKELAVWAVGMVRKNGGVLEHPSGSKLWIECGLPEGNEKDRFGGYTIVIDQFWFGHRAEKRTKLYICGTKDIPEIPFKMGYPTRVINTRKRGLKRKEVTKRERSATPEDLARWLIETAKRCKKLSEMDEMRATAGADEAAHERHRCKKLNEMSG